MPLFIAMLVIGLIVYCVLDVMLTDEGAIRGLPKLVWLFIVIMLPIIGAAVWFLGGRPENAGISPGTTASVTRESAARRGPSGPPAGRRQVGSRPARPAPRGPEDDPEFLKKIEDRLRRERRDRSQGPEDEPNKDE